MAPLGIVFLIAGLSVATALRPADVNPCYRNCDDFPFPMTCVYNWTMGAYLSLASPQCGNCPSVAGDCSKEGCFAADGVQRAVSLLNRVFPAPGVQICSGDEVVINVTNSMSNSEGVTLHWHGIFQNGSQFMDGLPMVTQCPIPDPGNFEYRFTPYEPGTHWYHSHTGLQRGDGVMGPFVIRESKATDPHGNLYDQDLAEHVVFMNDWHHQTTVAAFSQDQWSDVGPAVDSILINGKGIAPGASPPHLPVEVFEVTQGQRYRFRVINGATFFCNMQFSVQGHSLLAIASDGGSFQPQAVDYFRINGGERIDFVLTANQTVDNYLIQVRGLNCTNSLGGPTSQVAHLHYAGASDPPVLSGVPNITAHQDVRSWWKVFPDKSFAEVQSTDSDYRSTSGSVKNQEYIEVSFGNHIDPLTNSRRLYPQLNYISFQFPTSPVMSQGQDLPDSIFCDENDFAPGECQGDELCSCVHTINVRQNERLEVILVNPDAQFSVLHPMHLHGQQFKVVAMDKIEGATVEKVREMLNNGSITRNENGPRKDVVVVPNGGYTIFQFQGWNPGWWIFHCHIEFHLEEGMALLFNVHGDVEAVPNAWPTCGVWPPRSPPVVGSQPCPGPIIGSDPLVHLGWALPLTFLLALVIGLGVGWCVGGRSRSGTDNTVSIQMRSSPSS